MAEGERVQGREGERERGREGEGERVGRGELGSTVQCHCKKLLAPNPVH